MTEKKPVLLCRDNGVPRLADPEEWRADCMFYRGLVLRGKFAHWCMGWDFLPVDETCPEWEACSCFVDAGREDEEP